MAELVVRCKTGSAEATVEWQGQTYPARIGRSGPIQAEHKRENDGHTPIGTYPLLLGFYRADRGSKPNETFPWKALQPGDGYCDDPADPLYNQFVWAPHPGGTPSMYKDAPHHDVSVFIGYNVAPIVPGRGSATLLHGLAEGQQFTQSCVALKPEHVRAIAQTLKLGDTITITL